MPSRHSPIVLAVSLTAALAVTLFSGAVPAATTRSRVSGSAAPAHPFEGVYRVTQHPRCLNCHPAGDHPLHGDDSHPHAFGVKRGVDGKGLPGARCVKCHQAANQPGLHRPPGATYPAAAHQPPGAVRWHLPAATAPLVFQGRSAGDLCRQLLDRRRNGGLEPAGLIAHVASDPFVLWAWNPGEGRTTPPGTHADLVSAVRSWVGSGPSCPEE